MRLKLLAVAFAVLAQVGCAGGFRVGGNNYGAGLGGYIGPVPDAIRPERNSYAPILEPPLPPPVSTAAQPQE